MGCVGWVGGLPAWVSWPERPKGAKDEVKRPKGLQLEVGARRAPRLLVLYNSGGLMTVWDVA